MAENPYRDEFYDDVALVLNDLGKRCTKCQRVTKNGYLEEGLCPACRGQHVQTFGSNAGRRCDTSEGPCSCGAWH